MKKNDHLRHSSGNVSNVHQVQMDNIALTLENMIIFI